MTPQRVSLGIAGKLGADKAAALAPRLEEAGFHSLWINETPGVNALDVAAAAVRETDRLRVATGVIAVDRRPASELLDDIARLELPADRLTLGIGSGQTRKGALAMVEHTLADLREGTSARLALGALGPKMRALAAERADDVVLSWLTPDAAAEQASAARRGGGSAVLYVRTNADPAARARLEKEADQYATFGAYSAHFSRLGFGARDTVLPAPGDTDNAPRLAAYADAVDEVVLRAITASDAVEEYLDFLPLAGRRG